MTRNELISTMNITSTLSGSASIFDESSVECASPPFNSTSYTVSVRGKTKTAELLTIVDDVYLCVCLGVWGRRRGGRRMKGVEKGG